LDYSAVFNGGDSHGPDGQSAILASTYNRLEGRRPFSSTVLPTARHKFHTFAYWRTRLNQAATPKSQLLKLGGVSISSQMTLRLPLGVRLDVTAQDLPTALPVVLATAVMLRPSNTRDQRFVWSYAH
jgi:hypothetical protein